ncbi:ATP-binding protein [Dapis sp. BLCC M126]|uniref:ATP-binding protein n=1 Tax=Dapis sp. BLCC M126 TaxID=3400189 RepID=UPI003CEC5CF8
MIILFRRRSLPQTTEGNLLARRSIGSRLLVYIFSGAFLSLNGMAYVFYEILESRAKADIQGQLSRQVTAIEGEMTQAEQTMRDLAVTTKTLHELGIQDPNVYQKLVLGLFQQRSNLTMALGFGQAPFAIVGDRKSYWPYFFIDQNTPDQIGQPLPSPYKHIRFVDVCDVDDCFNQDYWTLPTALTEPKTLWLEPYQWSEITMTTVSTPIFSTQNKLLGMVGLDMNVTALSERVQAPKSWGSGYFAILSAAGNLLAYPPEPAKARALATYEDFPILKGAWEKISDEPQGLFVSKRHYWAYQRIKGTNWVMLAVVPQSVILMPVLVITISSVLGAGTIQDLVVMAFVRRLNDRLKPILQECHTVIHSKDFEVAGETQLEIPSNADELDVLNSSFAQMTARLRVAFEELEKRVQERTHQLEVAKDKAEVANEAKSSFIANMSHELRSPLNAILGFAQIMTHSQTLPKEHLENISIISRSGEHLLTLINNVLDLSKIEAGRITLNQKNFDLHRLLNDIEDMLYLKAEEKGLQLIVEHTNEVPQYICTDELKLRQVLINIINNAIKFTSQGGISLRVGQKYPPSNPTRIIFEVEDTGAGIAAEELDKLFEAFTQTETGKQAQEGTGLGLPISRKFVQLMGGDIHVTSQVNKGTIFTFEIEATIVTESEVVERQIPQRRIIALEPNQPRFRILIVDDKPLNRQLLIKLLSPLGFELKQAVNGQEAIEIWDDWQPQLIWMDMRMPVMDGYEATKQIKATTKGQATAIIALTASVLEEEKVVVLSAGCDDFMRKPFREADIFNKMAEYLGVRYVYEESEIKPKEKEETVASIEQKIRVLSEELKKQLKDGLLTGNLPELANTIAKISKSDNSLAEAIQKYCDGFEYEKILNWLSD